MSEPNGTAAAANMSDALQAQTERQIRLATATDPVIEGPGYTGPLATAGTDTGPTHAEQLVMSLAPVLATVASLPTTTTAPWYKSPTSYSQILASAADAAPGVLSATRASAKTAAQVQLGFMLASLVLSMFHRNTAA